jgi:uncharacterized protein
MARMPSNVAEFLSGKRFAVAGVSRQPQQAANAIFRKLRRSGFEVIPINPNAIEVEGVHCYADLASAPGVIDGVVVATHPRQALDIVNQCCQRDVRRVWFHRAYGQGSVSAEAVHECGARGIQCIAGGCPMMYCKPVDFGHRCMRWLLRIGGKVPG